MAGKLRELSDEDIKYIIDAAQSGLTMCEIVKAAHTGAARIREILRDNGFPTKEDREIENELAAFARNKKMKQYMASFKPGEKIIFRCVLRKDRVIKVKAEVIFATTKIIVVGWGEKRYSIRFDELISKRVEIIRDIEAK